MKPRITRIQHLWVSLALCALPFVLSAQTWDYNKYQNPTLSDNEIVVSHTPKAYKASISKGQHMKSVGVPDNYYDACLGFSGQMLRTKLHATISNGAKKLEYSGSSPNVWDMCRAGDQSPDDPDKVWLIYTEISRDKSAQDTGNNSPDVWNREHVWAKSRGDFGTEAGPGTDGHHLRAADRNENSKRSANNFDLVDGERTKNDDFYEPPHSAKGDVARMIFYMALRWENEDGFPDLEPVDGDAADFSPTHGDWETLLEWHEEDPVDPYEIRRNNVIYGYQNNRNPFVDHPELLHLIFGADTLLAWDGGADADKTAPVISLFGQLVDFPITLAGEYSAPQTYQLAAERLTAELLLQASDNFQVSLSEDAASFGTEIRLQPTNNAIEKTTIYVRFAPAASANAELMGTLTHSTEGGQTRNVTLKGTEGDPSLLPVQILAEDFEADCGAGWRIKSYSSDKNWACTEPDGNYGHNNSIAVAINNYKADAASNDWLISPQLDFTLYSNPYLVFWERSVYSGSEVLIKYATDYDGGDDPQAANWVTVGDFDLSTSWRERTIDIPQLAGKKAYFAFVHTSSAEASNIVNFDDFSVYGTKSTSQKFYQQITFDALNDKKTSDEPFSLVANASSGLDVQFSVKSGPASLNGNTLSLTGEAGIVEILAEQPGNDDYLPAQGITRSFEVIQEILSAHQIQPSIRVLPNPADQYIQLYGDIPLGSRFLLYNLRGKLFLNKTITQAEPIDISQFQPGVYLVRVITPQQEFLQKVVLK